MWLRIEISNWRSIERSKIELGPFTVIVGKNSSGKSNFVDAIKFVEEVATDAATAVAKRGGITSIRRWSVSKPYDIKITVRSAASRPDLEHSFTEHMMVLGSGKSGDWSFKREHIQIYINDILKFNMERDATGFSSFGGDLKGHSLVPELSLPPTTSAMLVARQLYRSPTNRSPLRLPPLSRVRPIRPATDEMRRPQSPSESSLLADDGRNVATALDRMNEEARDDVLVSMRQIVPGLARVEAQHVGRYLSLLFQQDHNKGVAEFAATEMSEGALRAMAVVVAAKQMQKNDVLIVEEPEVNLHPGAAGVVYDVLEAASSLGTVVVTTHSPELLDHAANADILVCEYSQGVTKVGPLADEQRQLVREGLFTVAELMRADTLRRQGSPLRQVSRQ